ncbi:uncharacterized protein BCR38DRAFT_347692, partial [Pseudomassariella vexata]
ISVTGGSLVIVCLRYYVRTCLLKSLGPDDWSVLVAWIASCGYSISIIFETKWGLGVTSIDNMPPENVYNYGLFQYIGAPFYVIGLYGFKLSLLLSYLRVVGYASSSYRKVTIGVIMVITAAHVAFTLVFLFECQPISLQWDPSISGKCVDAVAFYTSFSALTIFFDVVIMLLPFPILIRSKIQNRKKLILLGLFALGILITIVQALRFQTIQNLQNYLDSSKIIMWSTIECNLGIIVTCIPTLAPMVQYFSERSKFGSSSNENREPLSQYALGTWRTQGSGLQRTTDIGVGAGNGSTELILDSNGITKRTEVIIDSAQRNSGYRI